MENWLLLQDGVWLYIAIFFALLGGSFGLPIPEDLPLLIGGVLIHQGRADVGLMALVCYVAILLGDIIIYRIGNRLGPALFTRRWFRRRVSLSKIKKLRADLNRRSFYMILIARHLFYLRTVTFLVCGAVKIDFIRFLIADMLAAIISLPIMLGLGYLGAEHFDTIIAELSSIKQSVVLGTIPLVILGLYWYRRHLKRTSELNKAPVKEELLSDEDSAAPDSPNQE